MAADSEGDAHDFIYSSCFHFKIRAASQKERRGHPCATQEATQDANRFDYSYVKVPIFLLALLEWNLWSDTSIDVTVPEGARNGKLKVIVNSRSSNSVLFTVTPPEDGAAVQPASGREGTEVTILDEYGVNLGGSVLFGTTVAEIIGTHLRTSSL